MRFGLDCFGRKKFVVITVLLSLLVFGVTGNCLAQSTAEGSAKGEEAAALADKDPSPSVVNPPKIKLTFPFYVKKDVLATGKVVVTTTDDFIGSIRAIVIFPDGYVKVFNLFDNIYGDEDEFPKKKTYKFRITVDAAGDCRMGRVIIVATTWQNYSTSTVSQSYRLML